MIFTAPPTLSSFMQSRAFFRFVLGPVGSGKSTSCLMEIIRRASEQRQGPDGFRRTRFAVVRATLQQIKMTVLKEFYTWVAPVTDFRVSESTIHLRWNDVVCEIHLIPLDDERDQQRLLSAQLTGIWVNEFPEIDPALFPSMAGRVGRYPSSAQGGCSWFGVIADGNFPTEGGEWHELLEIARPTDWDVWKQPGGLDPAAENLENLPDGVGYYERLARQHSPDWVRRYVHAQYGNDPSGTAVYRESFKLNWHCADSVDPVMGHPLIIGQDFGRNPWSIITQLDHRGRMLMLEEIAADDVGLELHINRSLRPALMQERYLGRPIAIIGDPAGMQRSTSYEETSFDLLKRAGFHAFPAPTNNIDARLRGVETFLNGSSNGGPAMLIDKGRCPKFVRGMSGGYRFAHTRQGQAKPSPDKNDYSHVHDAAQYACSATQNGLMPIVASRLVRRIVPDTGARMSAAGWT